MNKSWISDEVKQLNIVIAALKRSVDGVDDADLWLQKLIADDGHALYALIDTARLAVNDAKEAVEAMRAAAK